MTRRTGPSWNPLDCSGTALPVNLLLMAKLIVLFLLCREAFDGLSDHFLPFVSVFDHFGPPKTFRLMLQIVCYGAAIGLLFNRAVRACAFVLGATLLISILSSRILFSNNRTFIACLLMLIGLHEPGHPPRLLQYQVVLLYLGSGLNKLLDPDWRTGQFVEFWTGEIVRHTTYQSVAAWLPPMWLSTLVSWAVIAAELGLAVLFLIPRRHGLAICLGIVFHTTMLVFSRGQISVVFYYAMLASYLAFVDWPERPQRSLLNNPLPYFAFALIIARPGVLAPWSVYWLALTVPLVILGICFIKLRPRRL